MDNQETQDVFAYSIDWGTIKNLDDIKIILKNLDLRVHSNAPNFKELKKYIDITNPKKINAF